MPATALAPRRSAFGLVFENESMTPRSEIADAHVDHGTVLFVTTNGTERGYVVKEQKKALESVRIPRQRRPPPLWLSTRGATLIG